MNMRNLMLACVLASLAGAAAAATPAMHVRKPVKAEPVLASQTGSAQASRPGAAPAAKPVALRPTKLSAAEIVDRNVAARGGLQAWRAVQTLAFSGQLEAGGKKNPQLPFVMEMKRPHKSRLEVRFQDQTAFQVYDGAQGWKVRPFLNRNEVEAFTPDEAKLAAAWAELDGPLVDYASKGTKIHVDGIESVEGRDAYRLKLTLKSGAERHMWIDAKTFLEAKIDGDPRRMDGRLRNVAIYYRDFRRENGLMVPHVLETVVEGVGTSHRMSIEKVAVNQSLDDKLFAKPQLQVAVASPK